MVNQLALIVYQPVGKVFFLVFLSTREKTNVWLRSCDVIKSYFTSRGTYPVFQNLLPIEWFLYLLCDVQCKLVHVPIDTVDCYMAGGNPFS